MKQPIIEVLKKPLKEVGIKLKEKEILSSIEVPPTLDMGDFAFPCFPFSEELKKSPHEIAMELREKIGSSKASNNFSDIQVKGGYLNFFIDRATFSGQAVVEILKQEEKFGSSNNYGKGKKAVVEFSSPNIAKPFGVGHLRSTIIGNSLANIAEFLGYKVKRINFLGDWGTQFGKLIYAYEKFGDERKLNKDPIKHLFELYVKASKYKKYEEPSREAFKRLEKGDEEAVYLWKSFKRKSLKEFKEIYDLLNIKFDIFSSESKAVNYSKKVLDRLNKKKLMKESQGALIVNLKKYELGVCLIQKTDGTTLYATRDLAEAIKRHNIHKFDLMIYETGQEQELHFKQIFKVLELMGHDWAENCVHVSHGLYLDKDRKKFSTRKGKIVRMKDIIEETKSLTKKEIKKRWPKISKKKLEKNAMKIAIAAIFYGDLKNNRKKDVMFDLKKFTSFEGDTGPYILYSYARAGSILDKASKKKIKPSQDQDKLLQNLEQEIEDKEFDLARTLFKFPDIIADSFNSFDPSLIANYSYDICKKFNEFYQNCPVIQSEKELFRLSLVKAFRCTLKNALDILGIDVVEKM